MFIFLPEKLLRHVKVIPAYGPPSLLQNSEMPIAYRFGYFLECPIIISIKNTT